MLIYIYVFCLSLGGLSEEVDEKVLHAAFIPFGDIMDIQLPLDYETGPSASIGYYLYIL